MQFNNQSYQRARRACTAGRLSLFLHLLPPFFFLSLSLSAIARNKTKVGESDGGMEGGRRKNEETGSPGVVEEEDEGGEEEKSARRI